MVVISAVLAVLAVALGVRASDPPTEAAVLFDVTGTYFPGSNACHVQGAANQYAIALSAYTGGSKVNVTRATDNSWVTISVECETGAGGTTTVLTVYDASGVETNYTGVVSSTACATPELGLVNGAANLGCIRHKEPQVLAIPAKWPGKFAVAPTNLNIRTPEVQQCRLQDNVTVTVEPLNDASGNSVIIVTGYPTAASVCAPNYLNGINITSQPIADTTKVFRFAVSVDGFVYTVNRVQYEGALEIFYDLPNSPPTARFVCTDGDCQPVQFSGTAVIGATLFLVFGLPLVVILTLGIAQKRARTHDE